MSERLSPVDLIEPYEQKLDWSCTAACFHMAYKVFGINISEDELVEELHTSIENGTEWRDIITNPLIHGLAVIAEQDSAYEHLITVAKRGFPVMVDWWSDRDGEGGPHDSLVKEVTPTEIILIDPTFGDFVQYSKEEFEKRWERGDPRKSFLVILNYSN